jgi:CheY-like chemotaxis protein
VAPTLLLADDSLTIRRVIELTFADEDIRVVTVADGREAIARISAEPPDIILADIGMPEHDGYEVAAFVKQAAHLAHIPVLLLTGAFEPVDEARARQVGCDGVLVKPFEPQLVIARVRELLAGRGTAKPLSSSTRQGDSTAGTSGGSRPSVSSAGGGDYLERLDAAFAAMSASPRPIGSPPGSAPSDFDTVGDGDWTANILTNDGQPVRASAAPPAMARSASPASQAPMDVTVAPPSLSQAFAALLAAERGAPLASGPGVPAVALSDATIDEIVRRVIARLGDEPMRLAVLDAAERLVREEIDRIKRIQHRTGDT